MFGGFPRFLVGYELLFIWRDFPLPTSLFCLFVSKIYCLLPWDSLNDSYGAQGIERLKLRPWLVVGKVAAHWPSTFCPFMFYQQQFLHQEVLKLFFCSLFVSDLVCFMSFCLLLIVCSPMFSTSSRNLPSTWLSVAEGAHLLPNSHLHGCQKDLGFSFIEVHRFHFRMFTQTCLNRRIGGKVDFMKGLFLPCDCEPTFLRPKSVRPLRTAPQAMRIPTPGLRRRGSGVAAWRTFVVQTWAMDNCEVYWCLLWHVIFNGTSRQGFSRARLEYQSVFISKFQSNFICWTLSRDSVYYDEARI